MCEPSAHVLRIVIAYMHFRRKADKPFQIEKPSSAKETRQAEIGRGKETERKKCDKISEQGGKGSKKEKAIVYA